MAFSFDGVDQSLSGLAAVTVAPITMVCWGKSDDAVAAQMAIGLGVAGSVNNRFELQWDGASVGDPLRVQIHDGSISQALSTTGYTSGVWHHGAAVFASATSHSIYIDGGSKATNTTSRIPSGINRTALGIRIGNGAIPFSGDLAEAAIWAAALTDAEIAWLAKGYSPLTLTHLLGKLVFYRDLIRGLNRPGIGPTLTNNNGATVANHPRIIYPSAPIIGIPVAAVGVTTRRYSLPLTGAG